QLAGQFPYLLSHLAQCLFVLLFALLGSVPFGHGTFQRLFATFQGVLAAADHGTGDLSAPRAGAPGVLGTFPRLPLHLGLAAEPVGLAHHTLRPFLGGAQGKPRVRLCLPRLRQILRSLVTFGGVRILVNRLLRNRGESLLQLPQLGQLLVPAAFDLATVLPQPLHLGLRRTRGLLGTFQPLGGPSTTHLRLGPLFL